MNPFGLIDKVRRTIDHYGLLSRGDQVIAGISAGVDSMVLLHLLYSLRQDFSLTLIIAHLNHGLRPEESEKEAELVQKESVRLGLPFEYRQFKVKEFQESGGYSLQEAARRIRFQFFNDLLQKYGGGRIALGHHADDQVETVLLRLLRGSALKGLKGMLPFREGRIIRPLLEVWKEEIEAYAQENAILYLTDTSNLKLDYLRNQVRLKLIPFIEKHFQPNFRRTILRTATFLRVEDDFIEQEAEKAYRSIVHQKAEEIGFSFSSYRALHPALQRRVLQLAIGELVKQWNRDEVRELDVNLIDKALKEPRPSLLLELSRGIYFEKRYDEISLKRGGPKIIPPFEVELKVPGRTFLEEIEREIEAEVIPWDTSNKIDESQNVVFLDFERLDFPLRVRNLRPGDRFQPMGAGGTQKLKKFLIDHKIPKIDRPRIPLLVSGKAIAWVGECRLDERFKVTPYTRKVLKLKIIKR